jgi:hypothetical protein
MKSSITRSAARLIRPDLDPSWHTISEGNRSSRLPRDAARPIDVRLNGDGDDPLGILIASRLTEKPYVAYVKRDAQPCGHWAAWRALCAVAKPPEAILDPVGTGPVGST